MHPILPFDPRKPGDLERAQKAGDEILEYCISVGGSITGEHGVGMEKMEMMAHAFPEETLDLIKQIKALFDPSAALNPGKVLPTGKGCLEIGSGPTCIASDPVPENSARLILTCRALDALTACSIWFLSWVISLISNPPPFEGFDPAQDAVWMAEVSANRLTCLSHKVRIAYFLSAMRHFAEELRL